MDKMSRATELDHNEKLMKEDPTDLTAIVYDGTDKIQHLFGDIRSELADDSINNEWDMEIRKCLNYYMQIDESIKDLVINLETVNW